MRAHELAADPIREAVTPADLALARALFEEYAAWLQIDLSFQGFAQELATLPGAYAPPHGRLWIAGPPGAAAGCIALRPLPGSQAPVTGEVKRLYVQPRARGTGLGLRLAETLISEARAIGYRELKLDTLGHMADARRLYERLGFALCSPYYHNPLPGTVYMARTL
ncbi:MAG: GNAT family N-acetyltransferase [Casimicrobiaceae bacterium]